MTSTMTFDRIMDIADRFQAIDIADTHIRHTLFLIALIPAILVGIYVCLVVLNKIVWSDGHRNSCAWPMGGTAGVLAGGLVAITLSTSLYAGVYGTHLKTACRHADAAIAKVHADHGLRLDMGQVDAIEKFHALVDSRCGYGKAHHDS